VITGGEREREMRVRMKGEGNGNGDGVIVIVPCHRIVVRGVGEDKGEWERVAHKARRGDGEVMVTMGAPALGCHDGCWGCLAWSTSGCRPGVGRRGGHGLHWGVAPVGWEGEGCGGHWALGVTLVMGQGHRGGR
jgi:hypothetical protein